MLVPVKKNKKETKRSTRGTSRTTARIRQRAILEDVGVKCVVLVAWEETKSEVE